MKTTHDEYSERFEQPYREPSPVKTRTTHDAQIEHCIREWQPENPATPTPAKQPSLPIS